MLAAAVNSGQEALRLAGDQDDVGSRRRLFERLEQRVLPVGVDQLGLVDDEHLAVTENRRQVGRRLVVAAVGGLAADEAFTKQVDRDVQELA